MSLALTLGAQYELANDAQFDAELEDILDTCDVSAGLDGLDFALRAYIAFAAQFYDPYLQRDSDLERCIGRLLHSSLVRDYRDRMINVTADLVATEQDPQVLHIALSLLLGKGATQPHIFRTLRKARPSHAHAPSVLAVCMSLIEQFGHDSVGTAAERDQVPHAARERLGVTATIVLYEICRVSRFEQAELALFTETFISHLFRLVESTRDGDEVFNYSIVRLIISLNEQFMVASVDASHDSPAAGSSGHHKRRTSSSLQSNRVLKVLSEQLGALKTFGENLIFILNRLDASAENLCVALLILKLLYLLFSTPATHEYFYTNDLCVLVDVFIRELSDLPDESDGLRHTYLRVLHPLLTNTQLRQHPYKRQELRRVLRALIADENIREVNATTRRLAERNLRAEWCAELERHGVAPAAAAKQASTGLAAITRLAPSSSDLPGIGRTASRASVASTSSDTSAPLSASSSTFGGHLFAEPSMSGSVLSVADIARTQHHGLRRPISSSSDLSAAGARSSSDPVYARSDSPALSQGDDTSDDIHPPRRGSSLAERTPDPTGAFLAAPFSPPTRPASAGPPIHGSPARRPPPPLPEHARRRGLMSPRTPDPAAAPLHKARRPPPKRPDDVAGQRYRTPPSAVTGLAIEHLTLS